jgi:hypothetical protein
MYVDEPLYSADESEDELGSKSTNGSKNESIPVELVTISMSYQAENGERWKEPRGQEKSQFYNVLWIEWIDGIAYRKGAGKVKQDAWEASRREQVDLIGTWVMAFLINSSQVT